MWLFLGIYTFLTLSVVFAVYLLHLTTTSGDNMELAYATSVDPIPDENKSKPDPVPPKPKLKKKPETSPPPKNPEEKKPKPKTPAKPKPKPDKGIDVEKQVVEQYPEPVIKPLL